MAVAVRLPKMSDTMEEGVIVSWQVKKGDKVAPGDILAEVETDKATMDLENYEKGTILHLNVNEGEAVPVDGIIAVVGKEGEDYEALLSEEPKKDSSADSQPSESEAASGSETSAPAEEAAPAVQAVPETISSNGDDRIKASPLARKMAQENGIPLNNVTGSGEGGRIVKRDIEGYQPSQAPAAGTQVVERVLGQESFDEINVSQMRKTIAKRLSESKFSAPHFYLNMEIRMDRVVEARKRINEVSDTKISVNDIIIKACAIALKKHPMVNSSWLGDKIRINHHIHVGVAMAVDEGLLVPVIRFADQQSLTTISQQVKDYSEKAKNKKLQPADWTGNTFTISNLGMFGIEDFTAVINPPDSCILAVGAVRDQVVVDNGEMKPAKVMKVTLSCDHRVVDGVTGAKFLQTVRQMLEEPVMLLV